MSVRLLFLVLSVVRPGMYLSNGTHTGAFVVPRRRCEDPVRQQRIQRARHSRTALLVAGVLAGIFAVRLAGSIEVSRGGGGSGTFDVLLVVGAILMLIGCGSWLLVSRGPGFLAWAKRTVIKRDR